MSAVISPEADSTVRPLRVVVAIGFDPCDEGAAERCNAGLDPLQGDAVALEHRPVRPAAEPRGRAVDVDVIRLGS